jgi:hypothetical protein
MNVEVPAEGLASPKELVVSVIADQAAPIDSALAHALRRRSREVECPDDVVAGHDSSL